MKKVLVFAAVAEVATGLALLIVPSLVGQLLLGEQLTGVAIGCECGRHRPDSFRDRLLDGLAACRYVDLREVVTLYLD